MQMRNMHLHEFTKPKDCTMSDDDAARLLDQIEKVWLARTESDDVAFVTRARKHRGMGEGS